jgi:hypothetical protein
MLDDTTSSKPWLLSVYPFNTDVPVYVMVTDSVGNICSDTVNTSMSRFVYDADDTPKWLPNEGAQMILCAPSHASGGFPPWKNFKWSPSAFITGSDSDACVLTVRLFKSDLASQGYYWGKLFSVEMEDARGCHLYDGDMIGLVEHSGFPDPGNEIIHIFPNPSNGSITVRYPPSQGVTSVQLFDLQGRQTFIPVSTEGGELVIGQQLPGFYLLRLTTTEGIVIERKIVAF